MQLRGLSGLKNKHVLALTGNIVIGVFNILYLALLARTLTKVDMGIWYFFLAIYGLSDAVRNGLLTTATVKFYTGTAIEKAERVLGSVWYLAIGLTSILVVVNLVAVPFIGFFKDREVIILIQWFGATILSSLPFNVTFWILVADEDYLTILWIRLVNSGSMIILIGILAFMHKATLENVLLVNLLTNSLTSVICIIFGYSKLPALLKRTKEGTRELLAFGKFSLASNLSSYLLGTVNTLIVNGMLGPGALAIFSIPNRLMEIIEIPLRSFVGTGMTGMAAAYNNNNMAHLTFVSKKYAGMLTLVFIPVAIITFFAADLGIYILGGSKYLGTEAPNLLRISMFIAILYPIDRFNGVTLDIIHQPKVNFYKVIIMGVTNLVAACLGIYILKDVYGVVFATFCATIAGILFGYYHLRKHLNYKLRDILTLGFSELKNFANEKILKKVPGTPQ